MDTELKNHLVKFENNINIHTDKVGQNIIDHFIAHMLIGSGKFW